MSGGSVRAAADSRSHSGLVERLNTVDATPGGHDLPGPTFANDLCSGCRSAHHPRRWCGCAAYVASSAKNSDKPGARL